MIEIQNVRINIWPTFEFVQDHAFAKLSQFGEFKLDKRKYAYYVSFNSMFQVSFKMDFSYFSARLFTAQSDDLKKITQQTLEGDEVGVDMIIRYDPLYERSGELYICSLAPHKLIDTVEIYVVFSRVRVIVDCGCVCITCRDAENLCYLLSRLETSVGDIYTRSIFVKPCQKRCDCARLIASGADWSPPTRKKMRHDDDDRVLDDSESDSGAGAGPA